MQFLERKLSISTILNQTKPCERGELQDNLSHKSRGDFKGKKLLETHSQLEDCEIYHSPNVAIASTAESAVRAFLGEF